MFITGNEHTKSHCCWLTGLCYSWCLDKKEAKNVASPTPCNMKIAASATSFSTAVQNIENRLLSLTAIQ